MAFASLTIDLNARLANIERDLGKMAHQAEKESQRMQASFAKAGQAATALVGTLGLGAWAAWINHSIDAADSLNDLSLKTQSSVFALASLKLISEQSGTSLEEVGKGINKLTLWMEENGQEARRLGISATEPVEAFIQFAGALEKTPGPGARAALANKVLGKSYADLLPLLSEGSARIRAAAEDSREYAGRMEKLSPLADKFKDQLERLKQAADLAAAGLANPLLPALTETATRMAELAEKGNPALAVLRGFAGLGKIPFDMLLGDSTLSSLDVSIERQVKDLQQKLSDLTRHRKDAEGQGLLHEWLYGSKTDLDREIEVTKNQLAALTKYADKLRPEQPAPARKDGGKSAGTAGKAGMNPLTKASIEASRWDYQLYDLPAFEAGISASEAVQAMIEEQQRSINELNAEISQDSAKALEDFARRLDSLVSDTSLAKTAALLSDVDFLNNAFFDGKIGAEQYEEAIAKLTGRAEKLQNASDQMAVTIAQGFERAIVEGKKLGEVFKEFDRLIAQMIIRQTITGPLEKAIKGVDWTSWIPKFAAGTDYVPRDMLAIVHQGEAIIPAAQNRAGAGNHITIIQHNHVDSRSDRSTILAAMVQAKEAAKTEILQSMNRGGTFSRATGRI